jgi:hypothetical protein
MIAALAKPVSWQMVFQRERIFSMQDIFKPITGNKMLELKQEIYDLRQMLAQTDDPDKIKALKKTISEKETYYNILADRARLQS